MQTLLTLQEQALVSLKATVNYAENNNLTNSQEFLDFLDTINELSIKY